MLVAYSDIRWRDARLKNEGAMAHARGEIVVDIHKLPDGREVVTVLPAQKKEP